MPSSMALRPVASNNALQQAPSRLACVEEHVQLQPTQTGSTSASDASAPKAEPSRLQKVSSKVQFWKGKEKGKEQDVEAGADAVPADQMDQGWQYSSNMVDVLDTVGKWAASSSMHQH